MSATQGLSAQQLANRAVQDPVYAYAEESNRASTPEQLDALTKRFLAHYQIDAFTLYVGTDARRRPSARKIAGTSHAGWRAHYDAHNLAPVDDLLKSGLRNSAPTTWTRFRQARRLTAAKERIYNDAAEFGLRDGFYLPLHQADGSMHGVSLMTSETLPTDQGTLAILHMLSLYYSLAAERLGLVAAALGHETAPQPDLTKRQIQCLQWIAEGKSSWEIGEILGLSEYTVNEHLAAARKRLGVRTTTQAAIQAVLRGFVKP